MTNRPGLAGLLLLMMGLVGCSGSTRLPVFPVKGSMTFEKKSMSGAMIVFHPLSGDAAGTDLRPSAVVQNDGTFSPTTYNHGDGLPAGEYALTLYWPMPPGKGGEEEGASGGNRLPPKYDKPTSSGLKIEVKREPNALAPINLVR